MSYLEELFSLKGRVALVAGASRGIGEAIAIGLHRAGARVATVARSAAPSNLPDEICYLQADVSDAPHFREVAEEVFSRFGRIDVYVHAAGISLPAGDRDERLSNFRETIEVNLNAAFACCITVSELMKKGGGGSIINITSIGSVLGFPDNPGYMASKGGLRMLTQALAVDLGAQNIRVNNLAPGYIRTSMTEKSYLDPALHRQRLRHMILPRWGCSEDLIGAAIFLASDASSYVTGQDLVVDGGWTAKGLV